MTSKRKQLRSLLSIFVGALFLLGGCQSGIHLPRPSLYATSAEILADRSAVDVELIAKNATEAPMWIRRVDLLLSVQGIERAKGTWDGDRRIEAGTSVLLALRLGVLEGASFPEGDVPGELATTIRYARSGLIGLMGGEQLTKTMPIVLRHAQAADAVDPPVDADKP